MLYVLCPQAHHNNQPNNLKCHMKAKIDSIKKEADFKKKRMKLNWITSTTFVLKHLYENKILYFWELQWIIRIFISLNFMKKSLYNCKFYYFVIKVLDNYETAVFLEYLFAWQMTRKWRDLLSKDLREYTRLIYFSDQL